MGREPLAQRVGVPGTLSRSRTWERDLALALVPGGGGFETVGGGVRAEPLLVEERGHPRLEGGHEAAVLALLLER